MNNVWRVYLHWTAGNYNQVFEDYHTVILGDGKVVNVHPYTTELRAHTYARNKNSVALSLACMGGGGFNQYPPTQAQIRSMCRETARLIRNAGWTADKIDSRRIMTHAEAAALRDYPIDVVRRIGSSDERARAEKLPHGNYGPMYWPDGWPSGSAERWDLWHLTKSARPGTGGDELRKMIREEFRKL